MPCCSTLLLKYPLLDRLLASSLSATNSFDKQKYSLLLLWVRDALSYLKLAIPVIAILVFTASASTINRAS